MSLGDGVGANGLSGSIGSITTYADFAAVAAAYPSPTVGTNVQTLYAGSLTYTAGGWLGTLGENAISYTSLPAVGASGVAIGTTALATLGTTTFRVRASTGNRWAVQMGQAPISDSGTNGAGYQLTATGTSLVVLASVVLPAGLIGLSEGWDVWVDGKNDGTYVSGSSAFSVRFQSGNLALTSTAVANAANRVARGIGCFYRRPSNVLQRKTGGISYSGVSSEDGTLDLSVAQTLEVTITPGASGNVDSIRSWGIARFA